MGKDKTGKFHPGKGKPSGINKEEPGLESMDAANADSAFGLSGEDSEVAPDIRMRHPNRNTSKGEDQFKGKTNEEKSNKTKNETFTEETIAVVPEELPGVLSKELFAELAGFNADNCISLFFATHRAGVEVNEHFDPIQFKNALQDVTNRLKEKGLDQGYIEHLLKPGYDMIRDDSFWVKLTPGLAVFIANGYFKYIKMPLSPVEETIIENSFYVAPLVPVMTSKEQFYLLVISKKQAKLFRADKFGMEYVPVENLPKGIEDVQSDDKDDETTFRTGGRGGRGGTGGANFHGIGGGNPDDKTNIATYLEAVDDVIWKNVLSKETSPLLLAGVEYLIPIYKSVSDYNHIWEDALTGSHEHEDTATLYRQAIEKMKPYFQQRVNNALADYGNKSATALTSSIAADVIPAAYYGKVSHLFVCKGEHIWGKFDENLNELLMHDNQDAGGEDLLDNAVEKTILMGGEVFILDKEQMPADSQLAAIMRY